MRNKQRLNGRYRTEQTSAETRGYSGHKLKTKATTQRKVQIRPREQAQHESGQRQSSQASIEAADQRSNQDQKARAHKGAIAQRSISDQEESPYNMCSGQRAQARTEIQLSETTQGSRNRPEKASHLHRRGRDSPGQKLIHQYSPALLRCVKVKALR